MPMNYPKPAGAKALEGPLVGHLREIAEGKRAFPSTTARRHHYVPSFALARFATPPKREGVLFSMNTASGKPEKTTPDRSAFVEELYSQETDAGTDRWLEAFLAVVENYAAPAIVRLVDQPLNLAAKDRQTISYYLAFQYQRTPVVIDNSIGNQQALMELILSVELADDEAFVARYKEDIDASQSDEEIRRLLERTRAALESGEIAFDDPKSRSFTLMLGGTDRVAEAIFNLEWVILRAGEDEFVTSDRAIAMHDSTPKFPWSGNALESSPNAETTFPLDPLSTIMLHRGPKNLRCEELDARGVRELNLRTYGWATEQIFGRSQEVLQRVRRQAKRYPGSVIRPRAPKPVLLEAADEDDPSVGAEHAAKGWPRGVGIPGEDGKTQFAAYTILNAEDHRPGNAASSAGRSARRLAKRSNDPGRSGTGNA
jgi:Protein of unknown function (DUF4238)